MSLESIFSLNPRLFNGETIANDLQSSAIEIAEVSGFCVIATWSGLATGNLLVRVSNDGTSYSTIETIALGGASGNTAKNYPNVHYRYARVEFSSVSGTSTISGNLAAKKI